MRKLSFVFVLLAISIIASAQRRNRSKYEWVYGLGATAFLGDLGGADRDGTHFIRDYEIKTTRPVGSVSLRRRVSNFSSVKGNFFMGYVTGADRLTDNIYRKNRNLSFRSPIVELSGQFEVFLKKEQQGALYKIKNARGKKHFDIQIYAFAGGGVFYFNPQAKYAGTWVSLQPLGTEGQGLIPGTKKYFRMNAALLYGFGLKYGLDRKSSLGVEVGFRKTFTDYIDDVSTNYYDNEAIRLLRGNVAATLADPNLGLIPGATDYKQQRGSPKNKDSYAFATFTYSYKILYKRKTRSKF